MHRYQQNSLFLVIILQLWSNRWGNKLGKTPSK